MRLPQDLTRAEFEAIWSASFYDAALRSLEQWRVEKPLRGYAIHSLAGNRVGVRLYEREYGMTSLVGNSLAEVVKALLQENQ